MNKSPRADRPVRAGVFSVVLIVVSAIGFSSCAHSRKTKADSARENAAEVAVRETGEDERLAPVIQRDMNKLFFAEKRTRPGGTDAFSAERLSQLETAMKTAIEENHSRSLRYYLENRGYFDRIEDAGGGFRIIPNAKRLVPFQGTKVGRRKLFEMDTARIREMIANPCLSSVEDCGEYSSDAKDNLDLLEAWVKKYPEKDFASEREKLLREYVSALDRYEARILKRGRRMEGLAIGEQKRRIQGWFR